MCPVIATATEVEGQGIAMQLEENKQMNTANQGLTMEIVKHMAYVDSRTKL